MCCCGPTQVERIFRKFPEQEQVSSFIVNNLLAGKLKIDKEKNKDIWKKHVMTYEVVTNTLATQFANQSIPSAELQNYTVKALSPLTRNKEGEDLVLRFFMRTLCEELTQRHSEGFMGLPTEGAIIQRLLSKLNLQKNTITEHEYQAVQELARYIVKVEISDELPNIKDRESLMESLSKQPSVKNILSDLFADYLVPCSTRISEIQRSKCVIL